MAIGAAGRSLLGFLRGLRASPCGWKLLWLKRCTRQRPTTAGGVRQNENLPFSTTNRLTHLTAVIQSRPSARITIGRPIQFGGAGACKRCEASRLGGVNSSWVVRRRGECPRGRQQAARKCVDAETVYPGAIRISSGPASLSPLPPHLPSVVRATYQCQAAWKADTPRLSDQGLLRAWEDGGAMPKHDPLGS